MAFLEILEELRGGARGEEGAQDEDLIFILDALVHQVDLKRHVGIIDRVFGVVEVELQELVINPSNGHFEAAVVGSYDLPRPLLELDLGFALVPRERHGSIILFQSHNVTKFADGLKVDGAMGEREREGGREGKVG